MAINWVIPAAPSLCFAFSGARCVFAAWLRSSRIHYLATYSTRGCRCQDPFPLSRGKGRRLSICTGLTCRHNRALAWLICSKQPTQKACKHVITQTQTHMCRAVSEQHLHNNFTHWCLSHQESMKHSSTDGHQFCAHMSSRTRTQFATRFKSCFATAPPRNPKKAPVPQ